MGSGLFSDTTSKMLTKRIIHIAGITGNCEKGVGRVLNVERSLSAEIVPFFF